MGIQPVERRGSSRIWSGSGEEEKLMFVTQMRIGEQLAIAQHPGKSLSEIRHGGDCRRVWQW
jgi:hypothetical protein